MGLTFSHLYLHFYNNTLFIQSAGELGCFFLTFLILNISLFIYKGIFENKKYFLVSAVLFILNISYGYMAVTLIKEEPLNHNISVIQGNISSDEKWENSNIYKILNTYMELSENAIKKDRAEVIVWPETVVPVSIDNTSNIYEEISNFARENKVHIITGAFLKDGNKTTNSVIVFNKEGKCYDEIYSKRHLIPFTELTSFLDNKIKKGREATVIKTDVGKIGALVCIDSAYPGYARKTINE